MSCRFVCLTLFCVGNIAGVSAQTATTVRQPMPSPTATATAGQAPPPSRSARLTRSPWHPPVFSVQISGTGTHRAAAEYSVYARWLAVARLADARNGVWVLDGKTGKAQALNVGGHTVMGAAFTPDGNKLFALLANNTLLIWNSGEWTVLMVPLTSSNIRLGFNGLALHHPGLIGISGVEPATFHGHLEIKGFHAGSNHKK